ncbi:hypothetical protein GF406_12240 [candidate division KSB1 bacterium]|nr:hypothetical protein [candidate division KSB1 bacterium]
MVRVFIGVMMSNNVELIIRRSGAYVIDVILLFVVIAPTAFLVKAIFGFQPTTYSQVWIAAIMSFSIPAWSYFLYSDLSWKGMTIGKRLLKVKVISINSNDLNFGRALQRTAIKLLPWEFAHIFGFALADTISQTAVTAGLIAANLLIIIYLVILVMNAGKKSLHDVFAKTKVVLSNKVAT